MTASVKRVLVVEDNPGNRYLATLLLEAEGFTVVAVSSGLDALSCLAADSFGLVLLDLQLPDIDGFEIAREIRRRHSADQLPIIAVSALAQLHDRREAFAAGCTGYLEKPIDAESFGAQIRCQADISP